MKELNEMETGTMGSWQLLKKEIAGAFLNLDLLFCLRVFQKSKNQWNLIRGWVLDFHDPRERKKVSRSADSA